MVIVLNVFAPAPPFVGTWRQDWSHAAAEGSYFVLLVFVYPASLPVLRGLDL